MNFSLGDLKKYVKTTSIAILLVLYGIAAYSFGKFDFPKRLILDKKEPANEESKLERPLPYSDTQSGAVIASYVKLCSNTVYGFELSYPKDWFTTYNTQDQKCAYFAPYSFVIPKDDKPLVPITLEAVKIEEWPTTIKFYENPNDFNNVISDQSQEINGKFARKIVSATTGTGLIARGMKRVSFLIFDAKTPLIVSYQQLDEKENVSDNEKILEETISTLKYF